MEGGAGGGRGGEESYFCSSCCSYVIVLRLGSIGLGCGVVLACVLVLVGNGWVELGLGRYRLCCVGVWVRVKVAGNVIFAVSTGSGQTLAYVTPLVQQLRAQKVRFSGYGGGGGGGGGRGGGFWGRFFCCPALV